MKRVHYLVKFMGFKSKLLFVTVPIVFPFFACVRELAEVFSVVYVIGLLPPSDGWSSMDTFYPAKKLPPILPPLSSIIDDVQSGLLHVLDGHLRGNDTALLLFYAPWCVHSSRAAKTIVAVADRLKEEVSDSERKACGSLSFLFSGLLHF